MKRLLLPICLLLAGCGTSGYVPREDETEVDVGYGTLKKSELTTAVSTVKVDEKEVRTYTNMDDYLRGKVAGLTVTPDNRILIRGVNSINSSTDPLILVDGMEVSSLSSVNPNDVQSVNVLKDASTSIYGVRGSNGVILITTKK